MSAISSGKVTSNRYTRRFPNGGTQLTLSVTSTLDVGEYTWGSETSQYPEEKKLIRIPVVAASELGRAQTRAYHIACDTQVLGNRK